MSRVDDTDYDSLAQWKWYINSTGRVARQQTVPGGQQTILLHRYLMGLAVGDRRRVDHEDRDPLNNQRSNLRFATHAENMQNVSPRRGASSQYRGVSLRRSSGKWMAYGQVNGKLHHLGDYHEELEAAQVAAAWRARHHKFAID